MAKGNNILGIESIELGQPGDGVTGTDLTVFKDIEVNSTGLEGSQSNETTISTETVDSYLTVEDTPTPTTLTFRLFGLSAEERVMLMGGTVGEAATPDAGKYLAPASKNSIYLSCKLTSKVVDGKKAVLEIPYGKVSARDQGNITKNGLPAVEVTVTANTPIAADGTQGAPYSLGWEDVV